MSGRRASSRSRKPVNYAAEGGENNMEDDDDEDFAVSSKGPASKKLRTATRATEKQKPSGATSSKITSASGVRERHAVGDRLFERDLEVAMSLSKSSSCSSNGSQIKLNPTLSLHVTTGDSGSVALGTKEAKSEIVVNIDQLESDFCEVTKQVNIDKNSVDDKKKDNFQSHDGDENNDPDYSNRDSVDNETSDEEDSSDEDDDGDSSFDSGHKHHPKGRTLAKKNVKPVTAKSTKPDKHMSQKSKQLTKAKSKPSNSSKLVLKTSPVSKGNVAPSKVNCTDKRIVYGSPTSGVLRLGLSRNARVKSLHQHATNSIT